MVISGENYKIKWSLRALMMWEEINEGKVFSIKTISDYMLFIYCVFVTSNDEGGSVDISAKVPYVAFIDAVSNDDSIHAEFEAVIASKKKSLQQVGVNLNR